jgi:lipopolysaccharide transport system permease protein
VGVAGGLAYGGQHGGSGHKPAIVFTTACPRAYLHAAELEVSSVGTILLISPTAAATKNTHHSRSIFNGWRGSVFHWRRPPVGAEHEKSDINAPSKVTIFGCFYNPVFQMRHSKINIALTDITAAAKRYSLVGMLGWQDVRQRYRRSAIGPFWLAISMSVMIGTIGIVFGQIFKSPLQEFLPFLAVGIILWSFISTTVTEGCTSLIAAEGIIKQLPIPLFVHVMRTLWRNILILGHNIVIFPLVLLAVAKPLGVEALLSIPGFALLTLNLAWICLILSVMCARYRDLTQIIGSILQIAFYLTPIMWLPSLLPERSSNYLLDLNPFYHLMQIVRAPLLSQDVSALSWYVSAGMAVLGWSLAIMFYGHYKRRIAYWL